MSGETSQLADFVRSVAREPLPDDVEERLRWYTLDNLAAGFLGSRQPWFKKIVRALVTPGTTEQAHSLGQPVKIDAPRASLVNGAAVSGYEIEHAHAGAHPAATVFPAVLALAEAVNADGEQLMRALAAGYEVNIRVALAQTSRVESERGFHNPSVSGVFGAAAGCAALLDLPVAAVASAFGIAASHACGLITFVWSGAETKRLHLGRAAQLGLESALLAAEGFMGPDAALESPFGYLAAYSPAPATGKLTADLGSTWLLRNITIKPHPAHGTVMPFVPVLDQIRASGIDVGDIVAISLLTSPDAGEKRHLNRVPATVLGAQYSVPFMVAVVLVNGADGLLRVDDETLHDERIKRLAGVVKVIERPGPTGRAINDGGQIALDTTTSTEVIDAPGLQALSLDGLAALSTSKFRRYTAGALTADQKVQVETIVKDLGQLDNVSELGRFLAQPEPRPESGRA